LDFFLDNGLDFDEKMDIIFAGLREDGFIWDSENEFTRSKNFISFKVGYKKSDILLKLDFVNDLVPHFGDIQKTDLFDRIDPVRNILSNKLSALFRYEGKDVADIREIALHESINWGEIIREAREKEAGLEIPLICEIIQGMPQSEFETIKWVKKPGWQTFHDDIERIVLDMMSGE
jgi:hypothetical protein